MVKLTAITFGLLFAITFGVVQGVDLPWVNLEFVTGITRQKLPEQVVRGVDSDNFIQQFLHVTVSALAMNTQAYHEQIFSGIKAIQKNFTDLTDKITTSPSEGTEENLKSMNKLMQDVIEVMPINVTIGPPSSTLDFPPVIGPIEADLKNKTATEILLDYPSIIERDFAVIRNVMNNLYMAGWMQARNFLALDQNSMRKAYTRLVVPFVLEKLEKVNAHVDTIRGQVSSGVWEDFIRLSDALEAAKIDKKKN